MADYQQGVVSGDTWVRCPRAVVENGVANKAITFVEEQVIMLGTDRITRPLGCVVETYTQDNVAEAFAVLDPATGEPTGQTATYAELYALLHSAYIHVATKRDQREAAALQG